MRTAIILVLLALFIAGCIQSAGGSSYVSDYAASLNRTPISDPNMIAECEIGGCHCMVCRNGTNIFGSAITSLVGASCYIEDECNASVAARLYDSNQTPDLYVRHFMIGQGPTFSDFAYANPYCSYRLSMAVQFLSATNETPYAMPDASRAICMLSKDIIPVYVLYSGGNNINNTAAREVGRILGTEGDDVFFGRLSNGTVGPTIVVAEIDFNASDAGTIANQIRAINEGCLNDRSENGVINCWVAVSPKIGDFEALDSVMSIVGDEIDIISFGVNNKYLDACDRGRVNPAKMMNAVRNFTEYAIYNHSKPSLIPYVLFDPGVQDAGGCNWTESDVTSAYSAFWPTGVTALQQKGLIGIAPYNFNSTQYGDVANPLKCRNCAVGSSQTRLRSWYGWCQSFTNITRRGANAHPSGGTPIIFPNASGGYCDFNANADYLMREVRFGDAGANRDIMSPRTPDVRSAGEVLFRCSACATNNLSAGAGSPFESVSADTAMSDELCHKYYPAIEYWSDAKSVDPMLVRAFIYSESGFDECAAAKVCRAGYDGPGCFNPGTGQDECYSNALNEIYDPSGECTGNLTNAPNTNDENPDWRWCAFGLAQNIAPPYTFWEADHNPSGQDGQYASIYRESGFYPHSDRRLNSAAACAQETTPAGEYNPFNPSHSICMAADGVAGAMRTARGIVQGLHGGTGEALPWGTTGSGVEKDEVLTMYIASHIYRGTWGLNSSQLHSIGDMPPPCAGSIPLGECFTLKFQEASSVDAEYCTPDDEDDPLPAECESEGVPRHNPPEFCYGETDPIQFFQDCIFPFMSGFPHDPGARKVELYFQFKQCPNNSCPDGRAFYEAMCTPDETGQLNPDLCIGPGQPNLPSSGTPYIPDNESTTNGSNVST